MARRPAGRLWSAFPGTPLSRRTDKRNSSMREILVLVGTFLPFIGIAATVLLAMATWGVTRWMILAGLPALTFGLCWLVMGPVWQDGNLLAAAIYLTYFAALLSYYPLLAVAGIVSYRRSSYLRSSGPRTMSA